MPFEKVDYGHAISCEYVGTRPSGFVLVKGTNQTPQPSWGSRKRECFVTFACKGDPVPFTHLTEVVVLVYVEIVEEACPTELAG